MTEIFVSQIAILKTGADAARSVANDIDGVLRELSEQSEPPAWTYPVGSEKFPTPKWYCAQGHAWSADTPHGHTGIDLNGDAAPWGGVDLDEPVWAIAPGVVHSVGWSEGWRGVIVIEIEHDGSPLWVRYAHLRSCVLAWWEAGDRVETGHKLGLIGEYPAGSHVHFDMARSPFTWQYWRTRTVRWIDPVPVLKAHLDPAVVDAMLEGGP